MVRQTAFHNGLSVRSRVMRKALQLRRSLSLRTALIMYSELAEPAAQKKGMAHVRLHTVRLAARLRRLSERSIDPQKSCTSKPSICTRRAESRRGRG